MKSDFDIFIPSYHRPDNCKTAKYYVSVVGWNPKKVTVFIDSEADDRCEYERLCKKLGCNLHVFDMSEARARYDYVHRASVSRRSAGQARNMMQEYAIKNGIRFYMVQDDDTSLFTGVMNAGLFTGSFRYGLILLQVQSAKQAGGLTDLYNECKLLNKSLVCPIQYPSAIHAEKQVKNGARLHHRISSKYLFPCVLKNEGGRDNIAWNTYEEDTPFTNEPTKRKYVLN